MKGFWLTSSIVFTVVILIIAFGNIQAQCSYVNFFFYEVGTEIAPTFTFLGISVVGIITGFCLSGLINSIFKSSAEIEAEDDAGPKTM